MSPDMMNSIKYTVDKLNEKNYAIWSLQVKLVLEAKGLWKYVESNDSSTTQIIDGDSEQVVLRKKREYRLKQQCLAEILLSIDKRLLPSLALKKEPCEVWEALKALYKSKSIACQYSLRRKLFRLKMGDKQSLRSFVESISEIENDLALSNYKLSADDKTFALLQGLRDEFDVYRSVLQNNPELSFEEIVSRLEIREEEILEDSETNKIGSKGFFHTAKYISHKSNRNIINIICHGYKKKGHPFFLCFYNPESKNYKPHLIPSAETKERIYALVHKHKRRAEDLKNEANVVFNTGSKEKNGSWCFDNCATQHMTHQREIIINFKECTGESIGTAARGQTIKVKGYFDVVLEQLIDGQKKRIKLKNVAYMPNIRTNLISQSMVQKAGVKIDYPPGTTNMIAKLNDEVIMFGTSQRGICELPGIKSVSHTGQTSRVFFNSGNTHSLQLMYRRMGYTNIGTLEEMIRSKAVDGLKELQTTKHDYELCAECCKGK